MTEHERRRVEARAQILKAVAHPSRLFIVEKLAERSHCVCELTDMIGADTSTVSKHLSILRNAGIISHRKDGTTVHYSLVAPCLLRFLGCVEQVVEQSAKRQLAALDA